MVGHGGSSAGSYLADPTSPIPSHCASIVVTSTLRVKLSAFNFRTDSWRFLVNHQKKHRSWLIWYIHIHKPSDWQISWLSNVCNLKFSSSKPTNQTCQITWWFIVRNYEGKEQRKIKTSSPFNATVSVSCLNMKILAKCPSCSLLYIHKDYRN